MKKKNTWKSIMSLIISVILALSVIGCGAADSTLGSAAGDTSENKAGDTSASAGSEDTEAVIYYIATEGDYAPYNYINENGEPDGYDIAVAKAVDELLDEVSFEYQAVEWSSIFAGLEAERYNLIVSQVVKTPEREEKYLFSETAYNWGIGAIAYQAGRTDIKSMSDLAGKTLSVAVGSSNANAAETWNAANGNVIELVYNDGDITKALLDVQEGRVDATLIDPVVGDKISREQGLEVECVLRDDVTVNPRFWLFAKDEKGEALKALADGALKTLIENGRLAEISREYLGEDYTTKEAVSARIGK